MMRTKTKFKILIPNKNPIRRSSKKEKDRNGQDIISKLIPTIREMNNIECIEKYKSKQPHREFKIGPKNFKTSESMKAKE